MLKVVSPLVLSLVSLAAHAQGPVLVPTPPGELVITCQKPATDGSPALRLSLKASLYTQQLSLALEKGAGDTPEQYQVGAFPGYGNANVTVSSAHSGILGQVGSQGLKIHAFSLSILRINQQTQVDLELAPIHGKPREYTVTSLATGQEFHTDYQGHATAMKAHPELVGASCLAK